jgi:hypothetical protein
MNCQEAVSGLSWSSHLYDASWQVMICFEICFGEMVTGLLVRFCNVDTLMSTAILFRRCPVNEGCQMQQGTADLLNVIEPPIFGPMWMFLKRQQLIF